MWLARCNSFIHSFIVSRPFCELPRCCFIEREELDLLRSRFMWTTEGILVNLGPHNCGKSAFLSHCFSEEAQKDGLGAFGSYMDGRGAALTDSAVFAGVLADQQAGWID